MNDYDKIIEVLERMRTTILDAQARFSEAADIISRKQNCLMQLSADDDDQIDHEPDSNSTDKFITGYDKHIKSGDYIKNIITDAQIRFLNAVKVLNKKIAIAPTNDQAAKIQEEINQAIIEVVTYNELLRRFYEAMGISNPFDDEI